MSDHKENNIQTRKKRQLNRIAEIRRLNQSLKNHQQALKLQSFYLVKAQEEYQNLYKRFCATQELIPNWLRPFVKFP